MKSARAIKITIAVCNYKTLSYITRVGDFGCRLRATFSLDTFHSLSEAKKRYLSKYRSSPKSDIKLPDLKTYLTTDPSFWATECRNNSNTINKHYLHLPKNEHFKVRNEKNRKPYNSKKMSHLECN